MYFLIEHNRKTKATKTREYKSLEEAKKERFRKEWQYIEEGRDEIEVVVFQSHSLETLKETHSRYFVKDYDENKTENVLLVLGLVALGIYAVNQLLKKK